jgi:hypothetical protein
VKLLREYVRRTLTEIVGDNCDCLAIFDFDDTLVTSDSATRVIRADGTTERLTSAAYTLYSPEPGDKFDYSEFDSVTDPKPTKYLKVLRDAITTCGADCVLILTARAPVATTAIQQFFSDLGIYVADIVTVGGDNISREAAAQAKALKIRDYTTRLRDRGLTVIHFYDDSQVNIDAVNAIIQHPPFMGLDGEQAIEVVTHKVDVVSGHGG